MRFRHSKQIVSLALAGVLAAGGMGVPLMRANAGEIMVFEQVMRGASMENGLAYSAEELNTDFNGTNVFKRRGGCGVFLKTISKGQAR